MKMISGKKPMQIIVGALVFLTAIEFVVAKPPDNAALLYYQAFMVYEEPENEATLKALSGLLKGAIQPSDEVSKYLKRNQRAIDLVLTAAEIPNCDWGLDFSQGTSMQMPYLSPHRRVSKIILADARILAAQGHHRMALSRCLTAYKMAAHAGNDMMISFLVGTSTEEMANECVQAILSEMPQDRQTLAWLKAELAKVEKEPLTLAGLKTSIENDFKSTLIDLTKDRVEKILSVVLEGIVSLGPANNPPEKQKSDGQENTESSSPDFEQIAVERIRAGDEHFFERNRTYWENYMARLISTLDFPYAQAYTRLKELGDDPQKDAIENPDASLTAILAPACYKVYHFQIEHSTFYNAILTAVDIYLIKARTGRLPDMLPAGSPKDLFSGKDFRYERKEDGFILRCQGKDLDKKKIHEYEFKLKK
jgi:hypothetical protein